MKGKKKEKSQSTYKIVKEWENGSVIQIASHSFSYKKLL